MIAAIRCFIGLHGPTMLQRRTVICTNCWKVI